MPSMERNIMKTFTQIDTAIEDAFSVATISKLSSQSLTELLDRYIMNELRSKTVSGRRRYPEYYRTYANGYIKAKINDIYRHHLEFCYIDDDGSLVSTHKGTKHRSTEEFYQAGRGVELGDKEAHHYWKDSDKAFS